MNVTPEQIDLIVQRVVARLGPSAVAASPEPAAHRNPSGSPAALQLTDPVITQALLAETLNGSPQVRISAKAILTPTARDFIRQRGIQIIRETASTKPPASIRWQVITTRSNPQITAALESLPKLGIAIDLVLVGLPAEAAAQAISTLCRGEAAQVVVFADQPELVACLANRNERVRAAAAASAAAIERVRIAMQANLIAVDPESRSLHELKRMLTAIRTSLPES
jgi:hypothetical protein